ncbi:MAG: NAD-dependent epimerase/dehydratase family protein [Desulfobulbaceae bacterium]|nr:NAD-dependent epimerase/dehydratase family protein [Desulfobulbaceae bacterium]
MDRALVTGGGGFVGLAIVRRLTAMGVRTTVVGRHHYPAAKAAGAHCLAGDIRDREFLIQACRGQDTVFHAAAKAGILGSQESYSTVNIQGTENVIAACRKNGIHTLVYTSTPSVVFDGSDLQGRDETLPYSRNPLCHYAATKIMAEKTVLAANSEELKTTAIRPHLVWGPGDTQIIPRLLQRGRQGKLKIVGSGDNRVDISYIDNVADAHMLAALSLEADGAAAGQAFFISQGEPVRLWDWINDLFGRLALAPVDRRISFRAAYRAGWILEKVYSLFRLPGEPQMTRFLAEQLAMSHWFTIAKAEKLLSYSPKVSTQDGVDRLVEWLCRQNCFGKEK